MTNQIIYDRKRSDVMIDLETMGTNTCAPIVSIGAVFFSPESEELGATFYVPVNLRSSMLMVVLPMVIPFYGGCDRARKPEPQFVLMMPLILRMHFLNYHTLLLAMLVI